MNAIDHQASCNQALARIIGRNMRSPGSRALVSEIIKEAVGSWAGDSSLKKKLAAPVMWAASRIARPQPAAQDGGMAADVGTLLTLLARKVNAERASGRPGGVGKQGEAVDAFLRNLDFGEILEVVEGADPHVMESIRSVNEQLWKYPAKVGALTVMAIALMNTSIKAAREVMHPIEEQFSPDLLADLILSVIRDINGTNAARLVNTFYELIRRVHTGSLRLGEGGRPLFQTYLTGLLKDCFAAMDPELVKKVRICLAEDAEAVANATSEALDANPHLALSSLSSLGERKSSQARGQARRLKVLEDIGESGFNGAVSESVSNLDTYEVAGLINTACRVIDRAHDAKPDIVNSLVGGIVDSVDAGQLGRIARWLIPDLVEALRPLAPVIVPELIKGIHELANGEEGLIISASTASGGEQ